MLIERTTSIIPENNLVMIVYGKGGTGKTTFAATAPNPLLLDFENGSKFLGERGIDIATVRMTGWFTSQQKAQLKGMIKDFDTVIIDPLGEAMEKLIDHPEIRGKKYRTDDGSLTMAGWGEVKKQMKQFIKFLRDSGKNVIIVSHVSETNSDGEMQHRIQVATKLSDEIPNMVDVISYLGLQTNRETGEVKRLLFTPAQSSAFDSKDRTGRIPDVIEISEHSGWSDFVSAWGPANHAAEAPQPKQEPQATPQAPPQQQQAPPQPQAPQAPQQPVQATQAPPASNAVPMSGAQREEILKLATRFGGPEKAYLLQSSNKNLSAQKAQEIIEAARAMLPANKTN